MLELFGRARETEKLEQLSRTVELFEQGLENQQQIEEYANDIPEIAKIITDQRPQQNPAYIGIKASNNIWNNEAELFIPNGWLEPPTQSSLLDETKYSSTVLNEIPRREVIIDATRASCQEVIFTFIALIKRGNFKEGSVDKHLRELDTKIPSYDYVYGGSGLELLSTVPPCFRILTGNLSDPDKETIRQISNRSGFILNLDDEENNKSCIAEPIRVGIRTRNRYTYNITPKITEHEDGQICELTCYKSLLQGDLFLSDKKVQDRTIPRSHLPLYLLQKAKATLRWRFLDDPHYFNENIYLHSLRFLAYLAAIFRSNSEFNRAERARMFNPEIAYLIAIIHDLGEAFSPLGDIYLDHPRQSELKKLARELEAFTYELLAGNGDLPQEAIRLFEAFEMKRDQIQPNRPHELEAIASKIADGVVGSIFLTKNTDWGKPTHDSPFNNVTKDLKHLDGLGEYSLPTKLIVRIDQESLKELETQGYTPFEISMAAHWQYYCSITPGMSSDTEMTTEFVERFIEHTRVMTFISAHVTQIDINSPQEVGEALKELGVPDQMIREFFLRKKKIIAPLIQLGEYFTKANMDPHELFKTYELVVHSVKRVYRVDNLIAYMMVGLLIKDIYNAYEQVTDISALTH